MRTGMPGRVLGVSAVVAMFVATSVTVSAADPGRQPEREAARETASCTLGHSEKVRHVIHVTFDNVHLTRDAPGVPSDLEQMPHLRRFIEGKGTMLSNVHDVLQHTATNVLTGLTGLYPDRHGVTQSNTFRYFNPDGTTNPAVSFAYWTDPIYDYSTTTPTDTTYNMIYSADRAANRSGENVNAPAPWVPFTRAGCDVGEVGVGNTVLENLATDIPTVFGAGSPQAAEVKANRAQAYADYVGIAVHCARGSARCDSKSQGRPDALPDEPGGYRGYQALFGNKYVAPAVHPAGPFTTLSGHPIADSTGHVGFPGFDALTPDATLGYVAQMQESGVPVTYAYISDAHDAHSGGASGSFGPGEAGYTAQLKSYDNAFATFFQRLARDGINQHNTLFVFTTDEGDHFVGSTGSPAGCGAAGNPCGYAKKGEISLNLPGLLATQRGNTTPFTMHNDPAPAIYVQGDPERTQEAVRKLERDTWALSVDNPLTGRTERVSNYLADPVEEKILHLVSADPRRTPTFTMFAAQDYYLYQGAANCSAPCIGEPPKYAWNHGTITKNMVTVWLGMVGPGVRHRGTDTRTWADLTDVRPTVLALLGLRDDYQVDGRVLTEDLTARAVPVALRAHREQVERLAAVYKQLLAGPGQFGMSTLRASTRALASGTPGSDTTYARTEARLENLGGQRDALTHRMRVTLLSAAFDGRRISPSLARRLTLAGEVLLARARALADGES